MPLVVSRLHSLHCAGSSLPRKNVMSSSLRSKTSTQKEKRSWKSTLRRHYHRSTRVYRYFFLPILDWSMASSDSSLENSLRPMGSRLSSCARDMTKNEENSSPHADHLSGVILSKYSMHVKSILCGMDDTGRRQDFRSGVIDTEISKKQSAKKWQKSMGALSTSRRKNSPSSPRYSRAISRSRQ